MVNLKIAIRVALELPTNRSFPTKHTQHACIAGVAQLQLQPTPRSCLCWFDSRFMMHGILGGQRRSRFR